MIKYNKLPLEEAIPASTISRALKRNSNQDGSYRPGSAEVRYFYRRRRERLLDQTPELPAFVRERLQNGWTPEKISGWLRAGNEAAVLVVRPVSQLQAGLLSMTDPQKSTGGNALAIGEVI
ncbi:MAG: hypothetical protein JKY17_00530 [Magnetovibrio sp.]|nr:hypothetical protein [Magnetovibrio sp.]